MEKLLRTFNQLFGKASMIAKLSLIFNIALAWVVGKIYNQKEELNQALVACHVKHAEEWMDQLTQFNYLKHRVKEGATSGEINKEIDTIIKESRVQTIPATK